MSVINYGKSAVGKLHPKFPVTFVNNIPVSEVQKYESHVNTNSGGWISINGRVYPGTQPIGGSVTINMRVGETVTFQAQAAGTYRYAHVETGNRRVQIGQETYCQGMAIGETRCSSEAYAYANGTYTLSTPSAQTVSITTADTGDVREAYNCRFVPNTNYYLPTC